MKVVSISKNVGQLAITFIQIRMTTQTLLTMGIGDIVELIIKILTLGQGKRIATAIARLFGYEDCGCDRRRIWLNNLFKPKHKRRYPI
jgi:hypothetical protein